VFTIGGSALVLDIIKAALSFFGLAQKQDEARRKHRLDDEIEDRLVTLLSDARYQMRTFKTIRRKIGGFDEEPDELRKHLVRIGAERNGTPGDGELWELPPERRKPEITKTANRYWLWLGGILLVVLLVGTFIWQTIPLGPECPTTCDPDQMTLEEYRECRKCKGLPE